jgi:hypothetical protein
MMKTLIATTLIATSAHGALCTFENLPAPTQTDVNGYGMYYDPLTNYEGFNFTYTPSGQYVGWYYYDLVGGPGWGGYDEGIIGDRAIVTGSGSSSTYDYRISRNEMWRLLSLEVTAAWNSMTMFIQGYRYGEPVFLYTAALNPAQRVKLNISYAYPPQFNNITEIKVWGVNTGSHIIIDNLEYAIVPAPSALALIGIAGMIGVRRRR